MGVEGRKIGADGYTIAGEKLPHNTAHALATQYFREGNSVRLWNDEDKPDTTFSVAFHPPKS